MIAARAQKQHWQAFIIEPDKSSSTEVSEPGGKIKSWLPVTSGNNWGHNKQEGWANTLAGVLAVRMDFQWIWDDFTFSTVAVTVIHLRTGYDILFFLSFSLLFLSLIKSIHILSACETYSWNYLIFFYLLFPTASVRVRWHHRSVATACLHSWETKTSVLASVWVKTNKISLSHIASNNGTHNKIHQLNTIANNL